MRLKITALLIAGAALVAGVSPAFGSHVRFLGPPVKVEKIHKHK